MSMEITEEERLRALEELWGPPPWEIALEHLYGREVMKRVRAVTLDGVRFVRYREPDWDAEEGDARTFEALDIATGLKEPLVRCKDCAKSRVETHRGDAERVCWKRKSHGEVVPDTGFCHDGVDRREGE